jgi:hypothetical protein
MLPRLSCRQAGAHLVSRLVQSLAGAPMPHDAGRPVGGIPSETTTYIVGVDGPGTSSSGNGWYCNASHSTGRFQNEPLALWPRLGRYNWLHGAGSCARHRPTAGKSMGGRADADQHQPPIAGNRQSPRHPQRLPSAINIAVNGNAASEQRYSLSLIRQLIGAAGTEPGHFSPWRNTPGR